MLKNKTHRTSCACYSKSSRYSLINVILIVNLIIDLEKKTKGWIVLCYKFTIGLKIDFFYFDMISNNKIIKFNSRFEILKHSK